MTEQEIIDRKTAREAAEAAAELLAAEAQRLSEAVRGVFWEKLAKELPLPQPTRRDPGVEPFSDQQARAWGRQPMRFGIHQGTRIDEVPLEYLEHIATPNEFQSSLRRYLASRRIRDEQRGNEEE